MPGIDIVYDGTNSPEAKVDKSANNTDIEISGPIVNYSQMSVMYYGKL